MNRESFPWSSRNPALLGGLAGVLGLCASWLPVLVIPSSALIAFVLMRQGWKPALLATATGLILLVPGWAALGAPPGMAFPLVLVFWPPCLLLSRVQARRQQPGDALLLASGVMVGFVLLMHAVTGDVETFWRDWLATSIAALPGAAPGVSMVTDSPRLINGFIALLYGLGLMLSLLLARWAYFRVLDPGGFGAEFRRLTLPSWVLALAVTLIWAGGLWDPRLMTDLLMVSMLTYAFVGLAVVHGVVAVRRASRVWWLPVYALLTLLPPYGLVVLAALGAVDAFVRFRVQRGAS